MLGPEQYAEGGCPSEDEGSRWRRGGAGGESSGSQHGQVEVRLAGRKKSRVQ